MAKKKDGDFLDIPKLGNLSKLSVVMRAMTKSDGEGDPPAKNGEEE